MSVVVVVYWSDPQDNHFSINKHRVPRLPSTASISTNTQNTSKCHRRSSTKDNSSNQMRVLIAVTFPKFRSNNSIPNSTSNRKCCHIAAARTGANRMEGLLHLPLPFQQYPLRCIIKMHHLLWPMQKAYEATIQILNIPPTPRVTHQHQHFRRYVTNDRCRLLSLLPAEKYPIRYYLRRIYCWSSRSRISSLMKRSSEVVVMLERGRKADDCDIVIISPKQEEEVIGKKKRQATKV